MLSPRRSHHNWTLRQTQAARPGGLTSPSSSRLKPVRSRVQSVVQGPQSNCNVSERPKFIDFQTLRIVLIGHRSLEPSPCKKSKKKAKQCLNVLTEGLCAFTWLVLFTVWPWEKEYSWNFGIWFLVVKNSHQKKNLKSGISKDNDNEIYRFPFCNMIQTLFTWLHLTQVPILKMDH